MATGGLATTGFASLASVATASVASAAGGQFRATPRIQFEINDTAMDYGRAGGYNRDATNVGDNIGVNFGTMLVGLSANDSIEVKNR